MTVRDWVEDSIEHYQTRSPREATDIVMRELAAGVFRRVHPYLPRHGRYIFDEDWDVLLVLDACRYDALCEVTDEYDFLRTPGMFQSRGSHSREWMQQNFVDKYPDEKARTAHVTWNAFSDYELEPAEWHSLDEVWRDVWDEDLGCVPPRAVTERAVQTWRETDADRMLVHYMQPHTPYRSVDEVERLRHEQVGEIDCGRTTVWDLLRDGEMTREDAWEAYLDNLRWVLDDIEVLLQNLDAEHVVVTADHGDCFGELGYWGHPKGLPLSVLRTVPWVRVSATDTGELEVENSQVDDTATDPDVEARLEALGYTEVST